ncbi:MAG: hypothetical protein HRF46_16020 [Acidobacteriota bacterium]
MAPAPPPSRGGRRWRTATIPPTLSAAGHTGAAAGRRGDPTAGRRGRINRDGQLAFQQNGAVDWSTPEAAAILNALLDFDPSRRP